MNRERIAHLILRVGVAFAFLYPAIDEISNPDGWIGYFPTFVHNFAGLPDLVILHAFGVVEVITALWILSGKKIFIPSLFATIVLVVIVGFNWFVLDILFRDLSIAAMSLALAVMAYRSTPVGNLPGQR
jgi:hypothetical protein